jgi:serine protease AprX
METKHIDLNKLLAALSSLWLAGKPATVLALATVLACSVSTVRRKLRYLESQDKVEGVRGPGNALAYRTRSTGTEDSNSPALVAVGDTPASSREQSPGLDADAVAPGGIPPTPPRPPAPPPGDSATPPGDSATPHPLEPGSSDRPSATADFEARDLDRMVVSLPLQQLLELWQQAESEKAGPDDDRFKHVASRTRIFDGNRFSVILDLNTEYLGGLQSARQRVLDLLVLVALRSEDAPMGVSLLARLAPREFREVSTQYVVARLRPDQIRELVKMDQQTGSDAGSHSRSSARRAIFRVWPDNVVRRQANFTSLPTIKVDAARNSFGCSGRGIVWAVVDSGIDGNHAHFAKHRNLVDMPPNVSHRDFVNTLKPEPLVDWLGHGTHVAGIIGGALETEGDKSPVAVIFERDEAGVRRTTEIPLSEASGVAPQCKLVSYKVLDVAGLGGVTQIMAALEDIHRINGYGKSIVIHGVNMSLGYRYDPQWFACGHSPLCEVVDRLVRSGICVVVAAGNSGYGEMDTSLAGTRAQGMPMSINDPGNAERAITVGSTHRDSPHTYGVSYFSSKGPTGDGRAKPDLLAPGEKIISCLSTSKSAPPSNVTQTNPAHRYVEDSGTSMAAPHVSGAIAALLSVRREFIGRSDEVKRILMSSALDLGRERSMQGSGLLNLFSALQSI